MGCERHERRPWPFDAHYRVTRAPVAGSQPRMSDNGRVRSQTLVADSQLLARRSAVPIASYRETQARVDSTGRQVRSIGAPVAGIQHHVSTVPAPVYGTHRQARGLYVPVVCVHWQAAGICRWSASAHR